MKFVGLARDTVFDLVRGEILSFQLQPGEDLRKSELAKRYGVSKFLVRDAVHKPGLESLVEIEPRWGHRVKPIWVADAEDILHLRAIIETGVVRLTVEKASDQDLACLDRFQTADLTSRTAFAAYDRSCHFGRSQLSGNRRLADETWRLMEVYDRRYQVSLSTLRREDALTGPLADHNANIGTLLARNGTTAARIVTRHVGTSRGSTKRGVGQQPIVD